MTHTEGIKSLGLITLAKIKFLEKFLDLSQMYKIISCTNRKIPSLSLVRSMFNNIIFEIRRHVTRFLQLQGVSIYGFG
jgi:hypothetical protein